MEYSSLIKLTILGVLFYYLVKITLNIWNNIEGKKIIKKKILNKQNERKEHFRRMEKMYKLKEDHNKILSLSFDELVEKLQKREILAIEALDAYCAKALTITKETNCITEFIPFASKIATDLDSLKTIKGPLHGLPFSVKDNVAIKGLDSTIGLGKYINEPWSENAVLVQNLIDLGAVPFVKTNVPQTLLSFECGNPVFGSTTNSRRTTLSPGGSSGGESTLIAAGGSILGIGSDIGGSVRIPSHFCGISGFKPTKERLSAKGFKASLPNVVGIYGCPGLLAKRIDTIIKIFRYYTEDGKQNMHDPFAVPIPWNESLFSIKKKFKIGYFTSFDFFPLMGDTEKVVLEAKRALEREGHSVIPFSFPDGYEMMNLVCDLGFADSGEHIKRQWKHEPIPKSVILSYLVFNSPRWLRIIASKLMECKLPLIHSKRGATFVKGHVGNPGDLWLRLGDRKNLIERIMNQWKQLDLDFVIGPAFPFPAPPLHLPGRLQPAVIYTMIFNLLDFPCGCVKFGVESGENIDKYDDEGCFILKAAKKGIKQSVGMPISVQVISLPFKEEICLRGLQELENLSQYRDY